MSIITNFAKIYAANKLTESCFGGGGGCHTNRPESWEQYEARIKAEKDARKAELKDLRSQYPGHSGTLAEFRIKAEEDIEECESIKAGKAHPHYRSMGYVVDYYERVIKMLNLKLKKFNDKGGLLFESSLYTLFATIYSKSRLLEGCGGGGGSCSSRTSLPKLTKAEREAEKERHARINAEREAEQMASYKRNLKKIPQLKKQIKYLCDTLNIDANLYLL